jgi:flagellar hook protein FlgE
MVKSMYAAVAGLKTHQSKMDVIGNNIANVNTYGYKKERATFADTYYATSQSASDATGTKGGTNPSQIGYGVKVGAVDTITTTGGNAITDNPTDVMITGNGYFLVGGYNSEGYTTSSDSSGVNGMGSLSSLYFTRVGIFNFDGQGSLVDSGSNYVMGFNSARGVQALKVTSDSSDTTATGDDVVTTKWTYQLASSISGSDDDTSDTSDTGIYTVVAQTAVDGTIIGYNVYEGTTESDETLAMSLDKGDFDPESADSLYVMEKGSEYDDANAYKVDQNTGYIKNKSTGVVVSIDDHLGAIQMPRTYTVNGYVDSEGNPLTVTLYGENDSVKVRAYRSTTDSEDDTTTGDTEDTSELVEVTGEEFWDLSTPIELTSISIGADGTVTGVSSDNSVMTLGKIAVANVPNAGALEAQGDNYFMAKANTGVIEAFIPGEGATGSLMSGALEMSNVDLSTEFTDMITTQRGYQANSRIITVTDSMLEELVNLKRS